MWDPPAKLSFTIDKRTMTVKQMGTRKFVVQNISNDFL
jgi:hypothetical protein